MLFNAIILSLGRRCPYFAGIIAYNNGDMHEVERGAVELNLRPTRNFVPSEKLYREIYRQFNGNFCLHVRMSNLQA